MVIFFGGCAYIQEYDVHFIFHKLSPQPPIYLAEALFQARCPFYIRGGKYAFDFIKIDCPLSISWLLAMDWLVDFDRFASLSATDLTDLIDFHTCNLEEDTAKFNRRDPRYRDLTEEQFAANCAKYDHLIASLTIMRDYVKGKVEFNFPPELQEKYTKTSEPAIEPKPKSSVLKAFFARLFKRSAH